VLRWCGKGGRSRSGWRRSRCRVPFFGKSSASHPNQHDAASIERDGRPVHRDLRWGVYLTIAAPSDYVRKCFAEYALNTDASGSYAAMYRPYHLIGLELGISVASLGLRREATGLTHLGTWPRGAMVLGTSASANRLIGSSGRVGQNTHRPWTITDRLDNHHPANRSGDLAITHIDPIMGISPLWNRIDREAIILESDSNRWRNTIALKPMGIVSLPVPQTAARRRDISLTLAM
jgi:hypothetical protein